MTHYFPIVFETETNGAASAYVPGLPVYAAADTRADVEQSIQDVLGAYLEAHPGSAPPAEIRVARVETTARRRSLSLVGVAALVSAGRGSRAKARAARANGKLGGRPSAKRASH